MNKTNKTTQTTKTKPAIFIQEKASTITLGKNGHGSEGKWGTRVGN